MSREKGEMSREKGVGCHFEGGTTEKSVTYSAQSNRFLTAFGMTRVRSKEYGVGSKE